MKLPTIIRLLLSTGIVCLIPLVAYGHTALKEATPADAAVVKMAPAHIELAFTAEVKLVKLELMGVGHEMPTKFEPSLDAKASYRIETPGMHPGEFTVNWAVIGADGHTVTGSYSFLVDPDAEETHQTNAHGEGHSHGDGDGHH